MQEKNGRGSPWERAFTQIITNTLSQRYSRVPAYSSRSATEFKGNILKKLLPPLQEHVESNPIGTHSFPKLLHDLLVDYVVREEAHKASTAKKKADDTARRDVFDATELSMGMQPPRAALATATGQQFTFSSQSNAGRAGRASLAGLEELDAAARTVTATTNLSTSSGTSARVVTVGSAPPRRRSGSRPDARAVGSLLGGVMDETANAEVSALNAITALLSAEKNPTNSAAASSSGCAGNTAVASAPSSDTPNTKRRRKKRAQAEAAHAKSVKKVKTLADQAKHMQGIGMTTDRMQEKISNELEKQEEYEEIMEENETPTE